MTTVLEGTGFVHRYVPGDPADRRVLLLLHGTGGNEEDLLPLGQMLAPGAALLSPRGRVLEAGMPRFFRRVSAGVFDVADLRDRALELGRFVEAAVASYGLGGRSLAVVGYSNGANIASGLMFLRPGLLAEGVLLRPMVPFDPDPVPGLTGTRVLLSAGLMDVTMTAGEPERLAEIYRRAGAEVTLRQVPAGHGLSRQDIDEARRWLERGQ
ncbi:MAG: alpha/beta hydrolase [Gemmatimonadales bacterium]